MMLKTDLIVVSKAFAATQGLSLSRVSTMVFKDGKVLARLIDDKRLTTDRFEEAMRWLYDNWPDGAAWPKTAWHPTQTLVRKWDVKPSPQEAAQ